MKTFGVLITKIHFYVSITVCTIKNIPSMSWLLNVSSSCFSVHVKVNKRRFSADLNSTLRRWTNGPLCLVDGVSLLKKRRLQSRRDLRKVHSSKQSVSSVSAVWQSSNMKLWTQTLWIQDNIDLSL